MEKVESPVRQQQLLSISFPKYVMSTLHANDTRMGLVGPLMKIVGKRLTRTHLTLADKKALMAQKWPIGKMVEYACYTVDPANRKKNKKEKEATAKPTEVEVVEEAEDGTKKESKDAVAKQDKNNAATKEDSAKETGVVEASSTLLVSIEINKLLAEYGSDDAAPVFYTCAHGQGPGQGRHQP